MDSRTEIEKIITTIRDLKINNKIPYRIRIGKETLKRLKRQIKEHYVISEERIAEPITSFMNLPVVDIDMDEYLMVDYE